MKKLIILLVIIVAIGIVSCSKDEPSGGADGSCIIYNIGGFSKVCGVYKGSGWSDSSAQSDCNASNGVWSDSSCPADFDASTLTYEGSKNEIMLYVWY